MHGKDGVSLPKADDGRVAVINQGLQVREQRPVPIEVGPERIAKSRNGIHGQGKNYANSTEHLFSLPLFPFRRACVVGLRDETV
jgi:hypothetical protein